MYLVQKEEEEVSRRAQQSKSSKDADSLRADDQSMGKGCDLQNSSGASCRQNEALGVVGAEEHGGNEVRIVQKKGDGSSKVGAVEGPTKFLESKTE